MTQAALAENQSSVTSTCIRLLTSTKTPIPRDLMPLLDFTDVHTHTHFKIAKWRGIDYKVATRTGNKTLQFH